MKKVLIGVVREVWLGFLGGAGREGCFKQKIQGRRGDGKKGDPQKAKEEAGLWGREARLPPTRGRRRRNSVS